MLSLRVPGFLAPPPLPFSLPFWPGPKAGKETALDHLVWRSTTVDGQAAHYGVAGEGLPVVFLHGWALGQHAYKRALKRLVHLGCRVYAPAMPGFGGTPDLPGGHHQMDQYAAWVAGFLDAVEVDEPAFVIGHSFGGGVATMLAHDFADKVGYLVLVNAVGGPTWTQSGTQVRSMSERPLWDWGLHFPCDLFPPSKIMHLLSVMLEDAFPNLVSNPLALWRAGQVARTADLTAALIELGRRPLSVVVLWGEKDTVIPRASFEAVCAAVGSVGNVVPGHHCWLLADPDAFGEVMADLVAVAQAARDGKQHRNSSGHALPSLAVTADRVAP